MSARCRPMNFVPLETKHRQRGVDKKEAKVVSIGSSQQQTARRLTMVTVGVMGSRKLD